MHTIIQNFRILIITNQFLTYLKQESLAKAKVSARQQCVYEDQFCHLTVV